LFFVHFSSVKKPELNRKIGKKIIALRTAKGMSQSDLARACGKDRQNIEKLENGRVNPTLFSLYEIAEALEVELRELVDF
jgi:putative transcriptional regulator